MRGLEGKVAIVTGGAASIGRAITEAFHGAGARVVVAARSQEQGEAIAAELEPNVVFQRTDITDDRDLDRLIHRAIATFGQLDFLINNACSYLDSGQHSTRAEWLTTLNTNLVSAALLGERARPDIARRKGAIVNISSISAYSAQSGRWTYPASKAALLHLTRLQALDYAKDGIRVNTLVAGWTQSQPIDSLSNARFGEGGIAWQRSFTCWAAWDARMRWRAAFYFCARTRPVSSRAASSRWTAGIWPWVRNSQVLPSPS